MRVGAHLVGLHVDLPVELAVLGAVAGERIRRKLEGERERLARLDVARVERLRRADRRFLVVRALLVEGEHDLEGTRAAALGDEDRAGNALAGREALAVELELEGRAHGRTSNVQLATASGRSRAISSASACHSNDRHEPVVGVRSLGRDGEREPLLRLRGGDLAPLLVREVLPRDAARAVLRRLLDVVALQAEDPDPEADARVRAVADRDRRRRGSRRGERPPAWRSRPCPNAAAASVDSAARARAARCPRRRRR